MSFLGKMGQPFLQNGAHGTLLGRGQVLKTMLPHHKMIFAIPWAQKAEMNAGLIYDCQFHSVLFSKLEGGLQRIHYGRSVQFAHPLAMLTVLPVIVNEKCNQ